jgi:flagellar biosynthesis protein FlhG
VSLNLALCFQQLGRRSLLVDGDSNLANLDILLGISPKYTLADAVLGSRFLSEVVVSGPGGLQILPAASGSLDLQGLEEAVAQRLESGLAQLEQGQDMIVLDTGAGISPAVVELASGADEVIVVTTPEPTAITDAYAAIKVITHRHPAVKIFLLVNQARTAEEAGEVARKIQLVVENYLALSVESLGYLPLDANVPRAVRSQQPLLLAYPRSPAALSLMMIARRLLKLPPPPARGSLFGQLFRPH